MKKFYFIALSALATTGILRSQTNAPNTNAAAEILALVTTNAPTQIDSDNADFNLKGRQAIYEGHVRVDSPQTKLTCARLTVDLPPTGGRINHAVAETNVVIDHTDEKGATNHVTCDKAVYDYDVQGSVTNDTITLTGNPQIVNARGTNTANVIVWNRANGHIYETSPHMSGENLGGAGANTNGLPAPKLF